MSRKREEARAAELQRAFDTGLNGTAEDFCKANEAARNKLGGDYGYHHVGDQEQRKLQKGALQAFQEGRPGNLQAMLAKPSDFTIYDYYGSSETVDCEKILSGLINGNDRQVAIITLALLKVPEPEKQEYLNQRLYNSVRENYYGEELVSTLLQAGANANGDFGGFTGAILARAIENSRPQAVVDLLYKAGASFEEALFYMKAKKWDDKEIKALKAYQQKITGKPVTVEVEPEILLEMRQMIADLTEEVRGKKSPSQPAAARAKKTAVPAI